jgi:hypothetical protein
VFAGLLVPGKQAASEPHEPEPEGRAAQPLATSRS